MSLRMQVGGVVVHGVKREINEGFVVDWVQEIEVALSLGVFVVKVHGLNKTSTYVYFMCVYTNCS